MARSVKALAQQFFHASTISTGPLTFRGMAHGGGGSAFGVAGWGRGQIDGGGVPSQLSVRGGLILRHHGVGEPRGTETALPSTPPSTVPSGSALPVPEDLSRRVVPGISGDPPSRMCPCPTQIEALYGRPIAGEPGDRSHEEQLIQRVLSIVDVPFGEPKCLLEVQRRQHVSVENRRFEVGRVSGQRGHDGVAESLPGRRIPLAAVEPIWAYWATMDMT